MMLKATAAAYLDMGGVAFEREVFSGNLPQPTMLGRRKRWDRHEIDAYLDRHTGEAYDWRAHQPGLQAGPISAAKAPKARRKVAGFEPSSVTMQRAMEHLERAAKKKPPKR